MTRHVLAVLLRSPVSPTSLWGSVAFYAQLVNKARPFWRDISSVILRCEFVDHARTISASALISVSRARLSAVGSFVNGQPFQHNSSFKISFLIFGTFVFLILGNGLAILLNSWGWRPWGKPKQRRSDGRT